MRLIHSKGFTNSERNQWKVAIFDNLVQSFQAIAAAMEEHEVHFADKDNIVR
jgi:guanine nucleotide-binding protein subunit alpha